MPRRPLFVTRKFPPSVGGMETLAEGVWRGLRAGTPGAILIAQGGSNKHLSWWVPSAVLRLLGLLTRRRIDFVLAGDALVYAILFPLLRMFRVPNATMVMGLDVTYHGRLYRALVLPALRRAPRVLAISTATADEARAVGVPGERVGVVRLGVPDPGVTTEGRSAAAKELRDRYGVADDTLVLLTLGRLVPRKGASWFTEQVLPALPTTTVYLLAGDGPEATRIKAAATRMGVEQRVRLLGRVDNTSRELLMAGADLFVQPNIRVPGDLEGFGLVTIEASMRGTPVVASAVDGILDAVVDGETGILLPPEDPDPWITRLRELLGDVDALRGLGLLFQARTRARYGEDEMARQLMAELSAV